MANEIFYLRKKTINDTTKKQNNCFSIINTSVPYKSYEDQNKYGYNYRPAIRMQFTPILEESYQSSSSNNASSLPHVFPSRIKIMKRKDYSDNLFGTKVKFKFYTRINNSGLDWQQLTSVDKETVFYQEQDNGKESVIHGIAFHQYVAYQNLDINIKYTQQSKGKVAQQFFVREKGSTLVLYQSAKRIVTQNYNTEEITDNTQNSYVTANLYYIYPNHDNSLLLNNDIFATLYINKSFYKQIYNYNGNDIELKENQYLISLSFQNFIEKVNLKIQGSQLVNGIYKKTAEVKNNRFIYSNQEKQCYIYSLQDNTNEQYWVLSNTLIEQNILNSSIDQATSIMCYKQITEQNLALQQFTDIGDMPYSQIYLSANPSLVGKVPAVYNMNSLYINYANSDTDGYINLFGNSNLVYCVQNGYRWIYDETTEQPAIFTRTTGSNITDQINTSSLADNSIKGVIYSTATTNNFKVNSTTDQKNYTIYFDYAKPSTSNPQKYFIEGIQQYFNTEILLSVQFKTESNDSQDDQIVHNITNYYKYAFGVACDALNSISKPLYLLYQQSPIQFSLNKSNGFPKYINSTQKYYANVTKIENDQYVTKQNKLLNNTRRIIKYRYAFKQFPIDESDYLIKWQQLSQPYRAQDYKAVDSIQNPNVYIQFAPNSGNLKQVYFQVADNQFNVSKIVFANLQVYTTPPSSLFIKITGTNGGTNYTGVYIDDKTQQFILDNKVTVQFSAYSDLELQYKIEGDIYKQYISKTENGFNLEKINEYKKFDAQNNVLTLQLIPSTQFEYTAKKLERSLEDNILKSEYSSSNSSYILKSQIESYNPQGILNDNNIKKITVTFRNQAGITESITGTIVLNTRLFQSKNQNLRQATSTYDLQIYKTTNNVNTLISRTDAKKSSSTRKWRDIFYPASHGYPILANGDIDETQAKKINQPTDNFDPIVKNNNSIVYDQQGRTTTVWSNMKKYPTMVSSYGDVGNEYAGFVYWIIDNKNHGDITLQFEHFYLDSVAYGPPYNQNLGQRPDSLIVYDASQQGCVKQSVNSIGQSVYKLVDTTKLKQLQVYSGSGANTMSLLTGTVNATAQGQFTTQAFATERLCLIFYSDYRNSTDSATSPIGSGFKLKAAKQIVQYWQNFDIDSKNGLVWVHVSSDNQKNTPAGLSVDKISMTYDYYNTNLQIDYDQGSLILDQQPKDSNGNVLDIYATYTYYTYDAQDRPPVRTFLLDADDLVDYADVNLYYLPQGTTPIKVGTTTPIYKDLNNDGKGQYANYGAGKLNNYFFIDKDRGVIQFNNGVSLTQDQFGLIPRGRIFGDYRYHTFKRLGNDGYSDFEFNDSMLIAGITSQYPDYTWGDIKIVNEGDAQLRDGKILFLPRGQIQSSGQITSVLDYDRPWDVQEGSAQQTYDKVRVLIRKNYAWNSYACTRQQAKNIYNTSDVNVFPDAIKPKEVFYGRIVYVLGGQSGDSYPTTTAGRKTFSSEISGRFIQVD